MIRPRHRIVGLARDAAGATAVEFALVAPILLLLLFGFFDFGYWVYLRSTAAGALEGAARSAGVGGAAVVPSVFQANVEDQIRRISPNATFVWNPRSYYNYSGVGKPEKLVTDVNNNGTYDPGDCWLDSVDNNVYDSNPGEAGVGGADDIVYYQLTVTFPPIMSIGGFFPNLAGNHTSVISTIVRRQPFAAQASPEIRC